MTEAREDQDRSHGDEGGSSSKVAEIAIASLTLLYVARRQVVGGLNKERY